MSVRGTDSTGAGAVPRNPETDPCWVKVIGGAWNLLDRKSFDQMMRGWYNVLLGHNRSTTIGGTSLKNAHPFFHEGEFSPKGILGMHNGTLEHQSKQRLKNGVGFSTDSEAIIYNLAHEGPEKTIAKLEGSYTLVWYDKSTHTISMIRNEKRPLTFAFSKDKKTLFFCSEGHLLKAALVRNNITTDDVFELKEDTLLTWKIPSYSNEFETPLEVKLEGYHYLPLLSRSSSAASIKSKFQGGGSSNDNGNFLHTGMNVPGVWPYQLVPTTAAGGKTITSTPGTQPFKGKPHNACRGIRNGGEFDKLYSFGTIDNKEQVLYDPNAHCWIRATWNPEKKVWDKYHTRTAPMELAGSTMDINANHAFKHVGKKKSKQIYFQSFKKGFWLTRGMTETFFSFGCMSCGRVPEWGNPIIWLNETHDFLCEFCAWDTKLLNAYKRMA